MNTMLWMIVGFICSTLASHKVDMKKSKYPYQKKYGKSQKKWQTEKPTEDPTYDPTPSPTLSVCPSELLDPSEGPIEYVFVVDNSCGLSDDECSVQKQEIADTFLQIKCDEEPDFFTKVAYIEFYGKGAKTLISLKDDKFQRDVDKYYEFILDEARCGKGGDGESDTVTGFEYALNEYLKNGDDDDQDAKRKIIVWNNCQNTDYEYDDDEDKELFEDVIDLMKDRDFFLNAPDLMVINVPSQDKPAKNAINDPYKYLAFLIGDRSSRKPSPSQIYVAPKRILNDGKISWNDYFKAALVENGHIVDRDDVYRNDDRLMVFVGEPNTLVPTADPTDYPTTYPTDYPTDYPTNNPSSNPTEIPTADPTEPKKVCFYVEYQMKGKKMMSSKTQTFNLMSPSWDLYKKGMKRPISQATGYKNKKCIYIDYPQTDYILKIKKGSGKFTWYVDGEECGSYNFGGDKMKKYGGYGTKQFDLDCSKPTRYTEWAN